MGTIQVDEAEHGRLTEAAGRYEAAEARATAAESERDQARAQVAAAPVAAAVLAESTTLPASTRARVTAAVMANVPVDESGSFDEAAFRTAVTEARTAAETELAEALEAAGVGSVRGFGSTVPDATDDTVVAEAKNAAAGAFGRTPTTTAQEG